MKCFWSYMQSLASNSKSCVYVGVSVETRNNRIVETWKSWWVLQLHDKNLQLKNMDKGVYYAIYYPTLQLPCWNFILFSLFLFFFPSSSLKFYFGLFGSREGDQEAWCERYKEWIIKSLTAHVTEKQRKSLDTGWG